MSVYMKNYVLMGYDLQSEVEKMDSDQLDTYMEDMEEFVNSKDLKFIFDGMSGEYCFWGKVLNFGSDEEGMSIEKHSISDLSKIQKEVLKAVKELKIDEKPALYSFTHWY